MRENPEGETVTIGGSEQYFVRFELDDTGYALPLDHVEQAVRMVALVGVPEAPPWIAGLLNLHGRVIPVIDLRRRFGLPPKPPHKNDRLLVIRDHRQSLAIMADTVSQVFEVSPEQIEAPPGDLLQSRSLQSVIRSDDAFLLILDPAQLAPPSDWTPEDVTGAVQQ